MIIYIMRNLVEISCDRNSASETISYYEEQGFQFISSQRIDKDLMLLVFEASKDSIANLSTIRQAKIQFDDGTESPLYIKRERNFWED